MSSPSAAGCEIRNFGVQRPLNIWLLKGGAEAAVARKTSLQKGKECLGVFWALDIVGRPTDPKERPTFEKWGQERTKMESFSSFVFLSVFFLLSILHVSAQCVREEEGGRGFFCFPFLPSPASSWGQFSHKKGREGKSKRGCETRRVGSVRALPI